MTRFSDFRLFAKILLVLVFGGFALSVFQLFESFSDPDTFTVIRIIDLPITALIIYAMFTRRKFGWWLLLVASGAPMIPLTWSVYAMVRYQVFSSDLLSTLARAYGMPLLILALLFTYEVRRHFKITERREPNQSSQTTRAFGPSV